MHRLLVESDALKQDSPELSKEAANHLKVLRPKDGEEIELFDGKGGTRRFKVEVAGRQWSFKPASEICHLSPATCRLTLFACVTKGSRWDWTIEKATELGVTRIVPVISERTIVRIPKEDRTAKRERWMRIAEDAARQSDAKWLPEILEPVDFVDSLALVKETHCLIGALTNPPPRMILDELAREVTRHTESDSVSRATREGWDAAREVTRHTEETAREVTRHTESDSVSQATREGNEHFAIFVGPEGDFTPEELKSLIEIATPVSFGPTILRAETAAIFGVSVLAAFIATR